MFAFPPRQLRAGPAAYYLGLSKSAFLDRVQSGEYPPGEKDGGARVWLRDDLDAAIDRRFGVTGALGSSDMQSADEDPFAARFRD